MSKLLQTPGDRSWPWAAAHGSPKQIGNWSLANAAISVWLDAPFSLCWKRIAASADCRPLAPNETAAFNLFSARTSGYELADLRIVVSEEKPAVQIAAEIAEALANTN